MAATRVLFRWLCAGLGLVFSVATAVAEVIPFAQVPPAVQKGIEAQLGNGTLGEIERDEEDGEITYTVDITKSGRSRSNTLDDAGALVSMEVFLQETPPPVQKAIQSLVGQGTIESIDKALDDLKPELDKLGMTVDKTKHIIDTGVEVVTPANAKEFLDKLKTLGLKST